MKKIHTFYRTVKLVEHPLVTNIYGNNYFFFVKNFKEYYDRFGMLKYKEKIDVYHKYVESVFGDILVFHFRKIDYYSEINMVRNTFNKIEKYERKRMNEFISKKFNRKHEGLLYIEDVNKIGNLIRGEKLNTILGGEDIQLE